jgi:GT2 family glycosyltransferase
MSKESRAGAMKGVKPQVSIIVVNWNRRALLEECLKSLERHTLNDYELILVDNGSTDGSLEGLSKFRIPSMTLVRNSQNYGFGAAVNQGIRLARGQFTALVNNDTALDPHWLEEMLRTFSQNPHVGMCAGKTLFAHQPTLIDKVGHVISADGQNYGRGHGEVDRRQYELVEEVLCPDGSAAAYRTEIFASVGLLDEDFFAYADDVDLGLRAQLCGWKCLYVPKAIAYHHHSATLGTYSPQKVLLVERNRIWLVLKLFPFRLLMQTPIYSALRYLYSLWGLLTGRGDAGRMARERSAGALFHVFFRAQLEAFWGAPRMLRKRRGVYRRRKIPVRDFIELLKRHSIGVKQLSLQG